MNIVLDDKRDDVSLATIDGTIGLVLPTELARELYVSLENVLPSMSHEDAIAMFKKHFGDDQVTVVETIVGPMCSICNTRIHQADPDQYTKVTGWRKTFRKGGGTHAIALRKDLDEHAHGDCVDADKKVKGQQRMV